MKSPRGVAAFSILCEGLEDSDPVGQADAARLLGELGKREAVGPLIEYVRTSRYQYKTAGFEALGRINDPSAIPEIEPLVDHPNTQDDWYWYCHKSVRAAAAVTLLRLGSAGGFDYLKGLAEKGDDVFFAWFAPAILELPSRTNEVKELQAFLTAEALCHESGGTRLSNPASLLMVVQALGCLGEKGAAKLGEFLTWRSRYVRGQAACSLLPADPRRENHERIEALFRSAPTDFEKIKYALALGLAGNETGIPWLWKAARDLPDPFERATALESLGLMELRDAIPVLIEALGHPHFYVRQCAIEALDRIGGPEAGEAVARVWQDETGRPRLQAAKFLAARAAEEEVK